MAQCAFEISGLSELVNRRVLSINITDERGIKLDKASIKFDTGDIS